jgi:hypothetical protein
MLEWLEERCDAAHSVWGRCNGGVSDRQRNQNAAEQVARLGPRREEHDEGQ